MNITIRHTGVLVDKRTEKVIAIESKEPVEIFLPPEISLRNPSTDMPKFPDSLYIHFAMMNIDDLKSKGLTLAEIKTLPDSLFKIKTWGMQPSLESAILSGDTTAIKYCMLTSGCPLHNYAAWGSVERITLLIRLGADWKMRDENENLFLSRGKFTEEDLQKVDGAFKLKLSGLLCALYGKRLNYQEMKTPRSKLRGIL